MNTLQTIAAETTIEKNGRAYLVTGRGVPMDEAECYDRFTEEMGTRRFNYREKLEELEKRQEILAPAALQAASDDERGYDDLGFSRLGLLFEVEAVEDGPLLEWLNLSLSIARCRQMVKETETAYWLSRSREELIDWKNPENEKSLRRLWKAFLKEDRYARRAVEFSGMTFEDVFYGKE